MNNKLRIKNRRLAKYLYSLGFDRSSHYDDNRTEYWLFDKSDTLSEALDFYFYMREKNK